MSTWIAWLITGLCIIICLLLWFQNVYRIMQNRQCTVESAAIQADVCRKHAADKNDPETLEILLRSEKIYQQAVQLYEQSRKNPWNCIPAFLMGFRRR